MNSPRFLKKLIAFAFVLFSLSFLFQNSSFAQTYSFPAQSPVYLSDASTSQESLPSSKADDETDWEITSVPIRPLLPGSEWEVESEQNGTKLIIKHGGEEALTLVKKE